MSLYWINREGLRLGIMPRPRGNDWLSDDLRILRQAGVDVIVSTLTGPEAEEWACRRAAFRAIEQSRGCSVPDTPAQRQWVERYSDSRNPGRSDW
jgi:hypothetical protein